MPAMQQQQTDLGDSWERGLRHLHPFFMLRQLSNNAQALAAEELTIRGDGATLAGANAGAQALAVAGAALSAGTIDAALCVAYDSLLAPEVLIELGLRRALTAAASREALIAPYAIGAAGAVPGEAAVALLLTRAEPLGPGGPPGLGYLRAVDGADAGSGAEQGPAATTLARLAAALLDRPVAVVDGAAQALAVADWAERQALHEAFLVDPEARLVATLAGCGQVGAAAPLLQAIALTLALRDGFLPAVAGLAGQPVADGPLRPLQQGFATVADRALALSAGAPGLAAALLIQLEDR
jgi:3-oxoacyl-[acyl-carrier-protein] synthase II